MRLVIIDSDRMRVCTQQLSYHPCLHIQQIYNIVISHQSVLPQFLHARGSSMSPASQNFNVLYLKNFNDTKRG